MMISPFNAKYYRLPETSVTFKTNDTALQGLYDRAENACRSNIVVYDGKPFLREGGDYRNLWLETQPMGGAMYACRNAEAALNNILVFMQYQRRDGRMPGMLFEAPNKGLCAAYSWFQGFCFPEPALQMYYLIGEDKEYLRMLYDCLSDFDGYLWSYRDNGDGLLERWCCWDTGEDNLSVLLENGGTDGHFGGEFRPDTDGRGMPWKSMEFMAYSYCARNTLAGIAGILNNGKESCWASLAEQVREKTINELWDPQRHACFDRYSSGEIIDCLSHVNLRCMYYGLFTQDMADEFVKYHLLNSKEFNTFIPLPSIAVNDPWFRNESKNNWSGPSQGLTWQRAAVALPKYGFHAEAVTFGKRWLDNLIRTDVITQQYDPFTGKPGIGTDSYGPTALSALEYIALMYGIRIEENRLAFAAVRDESSSVYTQKIGTDCYELIKNADSFEVRRNGITLFNASSGLRVVTDFNGNIMNAVSISPGTFTASIKGKNFMCQQILIPNQSMEICRKS